MLTSYEVVYYIKKTPEKNSEVLNFYISEILRF